jgi:glyoxylase-like metal-dependent hydrolase (beta-lactamase superfamily II)
MPTFPQEVADGVWRVKLEMPGATGLSVNVFVLRDAEGRLALVDTGWPSAESLDALDSALHALGGSLTDVATVLVTHGHPDHAGLASEIQLAAGCTTYLHAEDRFLLERGSRAKRQDEWKRFMSAHGMEQDADYVHAHFSQMGTPVAEGPPRTDHPDDELGALGMRTIWTPGHSPGHACFYMEAPRLLFSGDHVLPHITPNVAVHPAREGNPLGEYLASLDLVADLPADTVLPAHGEPFGDLRGRVDEIVRHHAQRMDEVLAALDGRARSARQVAARVSWKQGRFEDLSGFHQRMALGETLAHLRLLVDENRASQSEHAGRILFDPVQLH